MALFKILKGKSINLEQTKATEGYAYFTPDDGKFYIDVDSTDTASDVVVNYNETDQVNNKKPNRICINADIDIIDCGTSSSDDFSTVVSNSYDTISGGNANTVFDTSTENTETISGGIA